MNNFFLKHLFVLFILCLCIPLSAFAKYDPDFKWHTIETPHFLFHYHDGLEEQARNLITQSDAIQKEVSEYFDWIPEAKTHVIFNDHFDISNASATPFPSSTIELFMSPPAEISSLEDYDNWMKLVFKHEYVHIVHLDKARGLPGKLRNIFGRVPFFFPNIFSPRWITEGLATFLETDHENGFGRGQSSYYRGLMRNELINGFKSLNVVNQNLIDWPMGSTSYLYGAYFFEFLRTTYGDDVIKEYIERYSNRALPFFINTSIRNTTGKTMYMLWTEFEFYLYDQFADEMSNARLFEPKNESITDQGYFSGFSKTMENGKLLLIKSDIEHIRTLEEYDPQTKESRIITKLIGQNSIFGQPFDYHEKRGVLIPIIDAIKNVHRNFDLYQIDIATGNKHRLTSGGRYVRAIWNPSGNKIIAVKNRAGKHSLVLLDETGTLIKTLWRAEENYTFSSLDWSPDGEHIVASVKMGKEAFSLRLFNLDSKKWNAITQNDWFEAHPSFNADGSKIYYTADYDGIYNIYELDLKSRDLYKLTNTPSVALYPNVDEKNKTLYFVELGKNGFNATTQSAGQFRQYQDYALLESFFSDKPNTSNPASTAPTKTAFRSLDAKPYNAASQLVPSYWLPIAFSDESIGVVTGSSDPLKMHLYQAFLERDLQRDEFVWDVAYMYTRRVPDFIFTSRNQNFSVASDNRTTIHRNETELSFAMLYPYIKNASRWNSFIIYKQRTATFYSTTGSNNAFEFFKFRDEIFSTGISRDSSQQPGAAVNAHSGSYLSLAYENDNLSADEYKLQSSVILNATYYSPLVYKSVFEIGLTAVASGSRDRNIYLGGNRRSNAKALVAGKSTYGLKGFKEGQLVGTNLQKIDMTLHTPLSKPQTGIMAPPLGLSRIDARTFAQLGRVGSFSTINSEPWAVSIGIELTGNIAFGYGGWPLQIGLGIAKGLNSFGIVEQWLELRAAF